MLITYLQHLGILGTVIPDSVLSTTFAFARTSSTIQIPLPTVQCAFNATTYTMFYIYMALPVMAPMIAMGFVYYNYSLGCMDQIKRKSMHPEQKVRWRQQVNGGKESWLVVVVCLNCTFYFLYPTLITEVCRPLVPLVPLAPLVPLVPLVSLLGRCIEPTRQVRNPF